MTISGRQAGWQAGRQQGKAVDRGGTGQLLTMAEPVHNNHNSPNNNSQSLSSAHSRDQALNLNPSLAQQETAFRVWLRSPERIFVPSWSERWAQEQRLELTRREIRAVVASEPELTRLTSGRIQKREAGFRLRFWSEAEVDLGFINWNGISHGLFFLGGLVEELC